MWLGFIARICRSRNGLGLIARPFMGQRKVGQQPDLSVAAVDLGHRDLGKLDAVDAADIERDDFCAI